MAEIIRVFGIPKEEIFNTISHGIGFLLSIPAVILLLIFAHLYGEFIHIVSFSIYGGSLIMLYFASTVYHMARKPELKRKLNLFDHSAIYILIAGSYTPFTLVTLNGPEGFWMFVAIWVLALMGIIYKVYFIGRYPLLSAIGYVLMGWIIIFEIQPLIDNLAAGGLILLLAGGLSYCIGVLFFIKNNTSAHGIWHIFVLFGSLFHFTAILFYVL